MYIDKKNSFSVVIPTMWKSDKITTMLERYQNCKYVFEIIIIDNDPTKKIDLSRYSKIIYYTENKNIFVNPAWNLGYSLSTKKLILANDDIIIDNLDKIFELFNNCDYDIVGASLERGTQPVKIEPINKFPANSYGCFMYIKNYEYIDENFKIWYGDQFLFEKAKKKGILKNANIITKVSETINADNKKLRGVAAQDEIFYKKNGFGIITNQKKQKLLVVLVNYGSEQINFLKKVVNEIKSFKNYQTTIIVNSNIPLNIENIDKVNVYNNLKDYQLLPLTCRTTIIDNINNYDVFIYGENDHLFKEKHIDRHIEYSKFLPKNRIPGLIQYEESDEGLFYPAYHANYEWDFKTVETYGGKKFAHFTNVHQATFILTKEQLLDISKKHNFKGFFGKSNYSVKCKVNTDIYDFCGMKKLICISDFKDNLIHHLPNLYINGDKGRNKNQRADNIRMKNSLIRLFSTHLNQLLKIPKIIHQVWLGPKKPPTFMNKFKEMNPDYEYILWDEKKVSQLNLKNKKVYDLFGNQYHGKSDIVRYEVLHQYGGIYMDADCEPLRPFENFLLQNEFFSCYLNEKNRGDRLANGIIGCTPKNPIIGEIIESINKVNKIDKEAFEIVGPVLFTDIYNKNKSKGHIYPSYYFLPEFYNGTKYNGNFQPFCYHYWGTTKDLYKFNLDSKDNPLYKEQEKTQITIAESEKKKIDLGVILNKQPRKIVENKIIKPEKKQISPDITHLLTPKENIIPQPKKKSYYTDVNPMKTQQEEIRQMLIDKKKNTSLSDLAKEMKNTKRIK